MTSRYLEIHPQDPQLRLIRQAVEIIREGGVVVYPTDSCYALGCHIGDKAAMERISRIRQTDKHHHFTLVCSDLSEISNYARVSNTQYRTLKAFTPGPYTFILQATKETPRRLQNERRKTIGIRVPDHAVPMAILDELGEPIMSSTLILPGDEHPMTDGREIQERLYHFVDAVIDSGNCGLEPSSVIDLAGPAPVLVRRGKGDVSAFE
ncbi:threonylcarbamoyl-AMP synthase [Steroidobacter sp. S1-65]|uniref:Threonylcarbamoyl-AMP synthase n=1 Tax=Steroidobacter gossypii TaxID=2805490 RepID=A0ABS1WWE3_9GAMM|nr:L-threonylcarbamoyladenylate synthase [Steroidobacter gossypii]MBM0105301.1 threonylcarbamoyl-AMP synthase [Steroidobacter gossypii]